MLGFNNNFGHAANDSIVVNEKTSKRFGIFSCVQDRQRREKGEMDPDCSHTHFIKQKEDNPKPERQDK